MLKVGDLVMRLPKALMVRNLPIGIYKIIKINDNGHIELEAINNGYVTPSGGSWAARDTDLILLTKKEAVKYMLEENIKK